MSHPFGRPALPSHEDAERLRALDRLARDYAEARWRNETVAVARGLASAGRTEPDVVHALDDCRAASDTLHRLSQQLAATVMIMAADAVFERAACLIAGPSEAAE